MPSPRFSRDRRKKRHLTKHRHRTKKSAEIPVNPHKLTDLGLQEIYLSTLAQKVIECVLGEHVFLEHPWIYINKEKIEDHIYLHSESSEFLPLADTIRDYPEEQILICFGKEREKDEEKDLFFVCDKIEIKNKIQQILNDRETKMRNFVQSSLEKTPGEWFTYGSEDEIKQESLVSLRHLYGIEIECEFPIFKGKRRFSLSLAYPEDVMFVECLDKRKPRLVYKRRKTISIQASPLVFNAGMQTMQICEMSRYTQYQYEVNDIRVPLYKYKRLSLFLQETMHNLSDFLTTNACLNASSDDYQLVSKCKKKDLDSHELLNYFRDTLYSRNKFVSALVWHPKVSGLVAVAYAHVVNNYQIKVPERYVKQEFLVNEVLIWCYSSSVRPKLILHSNREVTSLCFCPYNEDILIGGCTSGQIVIWDLTDRLKIAEQPEPILTVKELRHHNLIQSDTSWIKFFNDVTEVKPTAISRLTVGHSDQVTAISWLSSNFKCTSNGKFINTRNSEEPAVGTQFITCAIDGNIYIWDLTRTEVQEVFTKNRRTQLAPSSPYRKLHYNILPLFKIVIDSPYPFLPLTNLLIPDQFFMYEVINPETLNYTLERTYFKSIDTMYPKKLDTNLLLVTELGNMFTCTWTGHDYDQNNIVNYAVAEQISFSNLIHDAPIQSCTISPLDNDFVLTVGGKIFAVWNFKYDNKALVWRKSHITYNSGIWSVNNVGVVILFRKDSKLELWDLLDDSKKPTRLISQTGFPTLDIFFDRTLYHVLKQTYFKADTKGTMKLTSLMSQEEERVFKHVEYTSLMQISTERIVARREQYANWLSDFKRKHLKAHSEEIVETVEEDTNNIEKVLPEKTVLTPDEKFRKEDFKRKVHTYLESKKVINIGEMEKNKHLVLKEIEEQKKIQVRLKEVLKSSVKIFESKKKHLCEVFLKKTKSIHDITESRNELKQMYMEAYYETENTIIETLQNKVSHLRGIAIPELIEQRKLLHQNHFGYKEILRVYEECNYYD